MDTMELLTRFADPEVIKTLSLADRLIAGLITTMLGMGITFISLVALQIVIVIMAKVSAAPIKRMVEAETKPAQSEAEVPDLTKDEEIVAAVSAALALQLKTSVSNIIIRNIERVEETSSAWHRAGIAEQVNNSI